VATATANGTASQPRIVVAVDDLFFLAKIRETARQLKVPIELAKTDRELLEKLEPPPALIILDLNSTGLKPLPTIGKLRHKQELKKTPIIGFLSHLQADLKLKAQEAGCNLVMPRSAFSQNLPGLLRRHGQPETV
jgi:CheY-like chemotaxis protein